MGLIQVLLGLQVVSTKDTYGILESMNSKNYIHISTHTIINAHVESNFEIFTEIATIPGTNFTSIL